MTVRAGVQENVWTRTARGTFVGAADLSRFRRTVPYCVAALLIAATVLFAISCKGSTVAFSGDSSVYTLDVEVADTPQERREGLSGRTELAEDSGMLFDFGKEVDTGFWMKDTSIPLSIAFVDSDGKIVSIQDMEPYDTTSVRSPVEYRYAIETNRGWFESHGIRPGFGVSINL